jgi:hypothetical protein
VKALVGRGAAPRRFLRLAMLCSARLRRSAKTGCFLRKLCVKEKSGHTKFASARINVTSHVT